MAGSCAKFILGGEHSVLHKGGALVIPLPQWRLRAEISSGSGPVTLNGERLGGTREEKVRALLKHYGANPAQALRIESEIPVGKGLGSSAALCCELARQLKGAQGEELARLAHGGEALFHGKSSGADPYGVALERAIYFQAVPSPRFELLTTQKWEAAGYRFELRDTGREHDTAYVIECVQKLRERTPLVWEDLVNALADNAAAMRRAFEAGQGMELGRLMNDTQFRLQQLGASNELCDKNVQKLRDEGALGAKVTGAGCGGFVLGLFPS